MVLVKIKCDHPVKVNEVELEAKMPLSDAAAIVLAALGLKLQEFGNYRIFSVNYLEDIKPWHTYGDQTVSDTLTEKSIVFANCQNGKPPPKRAARKLLKIGDDVMDVKGDLVKNAIDSLNDDTVWAGLNAKNDVLRDEAHAYLSQNPSLLESKQLLTMSESEISSVLKNDYFSVPELSAFQLAMNWGKHQLAINKDTDVTLATLLQNVLRGVRFPLMEVNEFATHVVPSNLLTQEQVLHIFQYIGAEERQDKTDLVSQHGFSVRQRKGGMMKNLTWDKTRIPSQTTLSQKNKRAQSSTTNRTVVTKQVFDGDRDFSVIFRLSGTKRPQAMVGLIPADKKASNTNGHIGDSQWGGWGVFVYNTWSLYHKDTSTPISSGYSRVACDVRLRVDCTNNVMSVDTRLLNNSNSKQWKEVTKNVSLGNGGPMRAAATCYNQGGVALINEGD